MTPITRALSAALLHFVWEGLGITILLWLALYLFRKRSAALRYAVSCAALALLLAAPAITAWVLYERPAAASAVAASVAGLAANAQPASQDPLPQTQWLEWLQTWAVRVWACGVLLFSVRMVWGFTQVAGLRRRGESAGAELLAVVASRALRMGVTRPVRVLLSTVRSSPSVVGWIRPVILLPAAALAGLTPEQLEAVLAHELAHIRRHDYLVNLLQMVAEALLFYHPAVWWVSRRIRHERELCCDDLAVRACGGALPYARALTALEKMRATQPVLALGSTGGPLFFRIQRLLGTDGEYGPSRLSGAIALVLGVASMVLCVHWARAQEPARGVVYLAVQSAQDSPGVTVDAAGSVVLHRTGIEYPARLREKGVQGTVSVEATLDSAGDVIDAHVLSGPDELRKPALSSILNWHFSPAGGGTTRVVRVSFQPSAANPHAEVERKQAERKQPAGTRGFAVTTRGAGGEPVTNEIQIAAGEALTRERNQVAVTAEFLKLELSRSRETLAALERQPNASPEQIEKARLELIDLERRVAASQQAVALSQLEQRDGERQREIEALIAAAQKNPAELEKATAAIQVEGDRGTSLLRETRRRLQELLQSQRPVGRKLTAIEIRGLSDDAARDLLAGLPVHEGETLTSNSIEAAGRAVKQFDEHLEFNFGLEQDGAVLRIHPPGAAGGPIVLRK